MKIEVIVMDAKLTLKLNRMVIEKAKKYAARQNRSLSRMVEAYLESLVDSTASADEESQQISDFVRSMSTGISVPADLDAKKAYKDNLNKKYQ